MPDTLRGEVGCVCAVALPAYVCLRRCQPAVAAGAAGGAVSCLALAVSCLALAAAEGCGDCAC